MNAFTFIRTLLDLALDALGIGEGQEAGTFTLELEGWLCYITIERAYAVLWDFHQDGNWEVYTYSHIPDVGFFHHSLYFNSTLEANETLPAVQSLLWEQSIEPLGYEVNEDDGPCIQFATRTPLDMEMQTILTRGLPVSHSSFDIAFFTSYEQYQQWRNMPDQDEQGPSEEERIEARSQHWQERKAIEADYYIQRPW
jgi:hypothetical protein